MVHVFRKFSFSYPIYYLSPRFILKKIQKYKPGVICGSSRKIENLRETWRNVGGWEGGTTEPRRRFDKFREDLRFFEKNHK